MTACIEKRGSLPQRSLRGTCLNAGFILSKAMLNNSHTYHQTKHDIQRRRSEVSNISLNIPIMLKAKEDAVTGYYEGY